MHFFNSFKHDKVKLNSVKIIGFAAFESCKNLKTIDLPNCEEIDQDAFKDCINLENILLPKLILIGVSAFQNTGLKKVELNSVTSLYHNNGNLGNQFAGCSKLTHITMTNIRWTQPHMFENCTNLIYVNMPLLNSVSQNTFQIILIQKNTTLISRMMLIL